MPNEGYVTVRCDNCGVYLYKTLDPPVNMWCVDCEDEKKINIYWGAGSIIWQNPDHMSPERREQWFRPIREAQNAKTKK